jgi:hypothetical protein
MKTVLGWAITLALLGGVAVGAIFLYRKGKAERDLEAEREKPIEPPSRVTRAKGGDILLAFPPDDRAKAGIVCAPLEEKLVPLEVVSYGRVQSAAPLLTLDTERSQAETALAASKAEYERTKTLFHDNENASRKALDQAQAQFLADQLRVQSANRQLSLEWGEVVTSLSREEQAVLTERLSKRTTELVRVTLLPGEILGARPKGARVSIAGNEEKFAQATRVFESPQVDPKGQGQGFLLRLDDAGPLFGPGAAVTAHLQVEGEPRRGVVIPRSAIVRYSGRTWVYALVDESHLARREVSLDQPTPSGWFSSSSLASRVPIVVEGPQMLLSEELKGEIHASD